MDKTRARAAGVVSMVLALGVPGIGHAQEHCNNGDPRSAFQTWGSAMRIIFGSGSPSAIEVGRSLCSYRLFTAPGVPVETEPDPDDPDDPGLIEYTTPICFCEHDVFLGGATIRFQSREEAQEAKDTYERSVTWAGTLLDGTSIPATYLDLQETPIEPWLTTGFKWWYQIGAILGPLAPGSYTSLLSDNSGDPDILVHIEVLPHAIAHTAGPAPAVFDGSVACPP